MANQEITSADAERLIGERTRLSELKHATQAEQRELESALNAVKLDVDKIEFDLEKTTKRTRDVLESLKIQPGDNIDVERTFETLNELNEEALKRTHEVREESLTLNQVCDRNEEESEKIKEAIVAMESKIKKLEDRHTVETESLKTVLQRSQTETERVESEILTLRSSAANKTASFNHSVDVTGGVVSDNLEDAEAELARVQALFDSEVKEFEAKERELDSEINETLKAYVEHKETIHEALTWASEEIEKVGKRIQKAPQ